MLILLATTTFLLLILTVWLTCRCLFWRQQARKDTGVQDRFARMFYLLPEVATITNVQTGCFVDVNHMWEPMFGFSRDETIGHTSIELDAWGRVEDRKAVVSTIMSEGVIRDYSFQARRKDKTLFDCVLSGSLIDFGEERYLLLIIRDVTEELRVLRALKESEAKFSMIFRESLAPLLLSRQETSVVLDVNAAWLDQMHWPAEGVIGASALELGFWVIQEERAEVIRRVKQDGRVDRIECHIRTSTGDVRLCLSSCRSLELGSEKCLLWGLQDITEQRAMENEVQAINASLEVRVRERTAELEKTNAELLQANTTLQQAQDELIRSEKMAALGGMVAGVSHELNTPIGNSVTAASALQWRTEETRRQMLGGHLKRSSLEEFLEYAETASQLLMRSLEQARELVSSFKQVAVDRTCDMRREFDLATLIDELLKTHHAAISHCPCKVDVEVRVASDLNLNSFPGSLGQVISNLINNALLHAFEGRAQGQIRITGERADSDHVRICFSDNGHGINNENLRRIFDPFFTTKFGQGGSGLGLYVSYNITTTVLGGAIYVESKPDQGTCFTLELPTQAPEGEGDNPLRFASRDLLRNTSLH